MAPNLLLDKKDEGPTGGRNWGHGKAERQIPRSKPSTVKCQGLFEYLGETAQ